MEIRCSCCNHFKALKEDLCNWCVDCPTGYCDVPDRFKKPHLTSVESSE